MTVLTSLFMEVFEGNVERVEKFSLFTTCMPVLFCFLLINASLVTSPWHVFFMLGFTVFLLWFLVLGYLMAKTMWERETGGPRLNRRMKSELRWLENHTDWKLDEDVRSFFNIRTRFERTLDTWEFPPGVERNWWER